MSHWTLRRKHGAFVPGEPGVVLNADRANRTGLVIWPNAWPLIRRETLAHAVVGDPTHRCRTSTRLLDPYLAKRARG